MDYGWDEEGNAFVKFQIIKKDIEDILGATIPGVDDVIEVEGHGAQVDDFATANAQQ